MEELKRSDLEAKLIATISILPKLIFLRDAINGVLGGELIELLPHLDASIAKLNELHDLLVNELVKRGVIENDTGKNHRD